LDWSPVVARALSLFGPGELRALRVYDANTFSLALSTPTQADSLRALCAVGIGYWSLEPEDEMPAVAIIERCAATVTELKGPLPAHLLC
jgi:hypothetical protein